jgi:hypothetical protein
LRGRSAGRVRQRGELRESRHSRRGSSPCGIRRPCPWRGRIGPGAHVEVMVADRSGCFGSLPHGEIRRSATHRASDETQRRGLALFFIWLERKVSGPHSGPPRADPRRRQVRLAADAGRRHQAADQGRPDAPTAPTAAVQAGALRQLRAGRFAAYLALPFAANGWVARESTSRCSSSWRCWGWRCSA